MGIRADRIAECVDQSRRHGSRKKSIISPSSPPALLDLQIGSHHSVHSIRLTLMNTTTMKSVSPSRQSIGSLTPPSTASSGISYPPTSPPDMENGASYPGPARERGAHAASVLAMRGQSPIDGEQTSGGRSRPRKQFRGRHIELMAIGNSQSCS
jgi:hypothetical protein